MCLRRSHSQPSEPSFHMMNAESDVAFVVVWFVSFSQQRVELWTSVLCVSRSGLDSMTADVTGDVTAQLYEGQPEVSRFVGELLIAATMRAYTEPMTRPIPFFPSSGERLLFRHAENKHPVDVSLERYKNRLRNEELVLAFHGVRPGDQARHVIVKWLTN